MHDYSSLTRDPEQFRFTGETGEYFRIWIVNMALTIVTLGIYSAWATVRKRRYFYTNTSVGDGHFDYHASPQGILVGRIIAVLLLGAYYGAGYISPMAPFYIIVAVFLMVPWFVVRSRRFQQRMTSYRGVRFNFTGSYGDAFKTFYGAALISVFSLGLATARANHMRAEYMVGNSGFGKTNFNFGGDLDTYYSYFWKSVGLFILVAFGYGFVTAAMIPMMPEPIPGEEPSIGFIAMLYAQTLVLLGGYAVVGIWYQVRIRNHVLNTTTIGGNSLHSNLRVSTMLWLYLTNLLAIIGTLGLAVPWAQIRLAKYRAESTQALLDDDWENYLADNTTAGSALGDELGEAFDVDVGLGF